MCIASRRNVHTYFSQTLRAEFLKRWMLMSAAAGSCATTLENPNFGRDAKRVRPLERIAGRMTFKIVSTRQVYFFQLPKTI